MSFNDKTGKPGARRPGGKAPFKGGAKGASSGEGAKAGRPGGFGAKGGFRKDGPAKDGPYKDAKPGFGKPAFGKGGKERFGDRPPRAEKRDGFEKRAARPAPVSGEKAGGAEPERISKLLARAGVASRRDVERMIMEGRVSVNGTVLDSPVLNATFADTILVDGKPVRGPERTRLWLYHKPAGLVTTNADPEGRPTVFDNLPEELPRVMSIGRLDINTEGLLLLTNDGGLARVLELPKTGWLRRYRVRAHGSVDQSDLDRLKDGVAVDGVLYGGIDATLDRVQGGNLWITMSFREGKNREVKNVLGSLGLEVNRLIRLSYGPFQLGDLAEGAVLEVRGRMLRDQLGPRLIEESGADFDAPLFGPAAPEDSGEDAARPAARQPEREERAERGGSSRGEGKPFRKDDKGARGGRDFDRPRRETQEDEDAPKRPKPGSSRVVNVWRAPGARPLGPAKAAKASRPAPAPERPQPSKFGEPVQIRRSGEDNEWISASEPAARKPRGDKGFGDKPRGERSFGDKPRGERSFGDGPRGERKFGDKPRGERSFGDKPRGERSFGDGPRGERKFGDKPRGERSFGDKPRGERSFGDGPRSDRPFGDKPRGPRPFGGKPGGGKPGGGKSFGGKPGGGRPSGGRPAGKPFGGKPGGRGRQG